VSQPVNIDKIIELVLQDAVDKELGASQAGGFGDNGASRLREQVAFYNYGRYGIIPQEWGKYTNKLDPEYQKYLELKKKFGG
jgi:hypothetical protein